MSRCDTCGSKEDCDCDRDPKALIAELQSRIEELENERATTHTQEPLLPSNYEPIHCDFNDPNASGALLHVFGNVGGLLLATIGERRLRAEFEGLIAMAPSVLEVKP